MKHSLLWGRRIVLALAAIFLAGSALAAILLAEFALHLPRKPITHRAEFAASVQNTRGVSLREVSIRAMDGVVLRGWSAVPKEDNRETVILLHGVTDNRGGMEGYAEMFLQAGYRVLLPDARAHGESGGELATYGLWERDDTHRWAQWARGESNGRCIFLFGESMGAVISIQTLASDHELCGVVAESPFSTFREIGYDRIAQVSGFSLPVVRALGAPTLETALLYVRTRYGVDLAKASPADCINASQTPVLMIAGTRDHNIPDRHAKRLLAIAGSHAVLWEVDGADHGGAVTVAPELFRQKVLGWLQQNSRH